MQCPKCRMEQEDQNLLCDYCGIVFAKYQTGGRGRAEPTPTTPGADPVSSGQARISVYAPPPQRAAAWLRERLFTIRPDPPIATLGRAALPALLSIWGTRLMLTSIESNGAGESFLHLVNLPFHEAGHVFFTPFGDFVRTLGGSLGQLIMPMVCCLVLLLKTRDPFGAGVALWWFGENFLDLAPYIDDAGTGELPLLGGNTGESTPYGFHDWEYLMTETGRLGQEHALARASHAFGSAIMVLALAWMAIALYRGWRLGRAQSKSDLHRRAAAVIVVLGLLLSHTPARAVGSPAAAFHYEPGAGEYIASYDLDLVVARVVSVRDSGATAADPPYVQLQVERVLHGGLHAGPLAARWVPWLHPPFRCGNETASERAQWNRAYHSPMHGPAVGERFLLAGTRSSTSAPWRVSEQVRYPYSRSLETRVLSELRPVDARNRAALDEQNRHISAERTADRRVLAGADLDALVQASTDVLIATLSPETHYDLDVVTPLGVDMSVATRLWSRRQSPLGARADSMMEYARRAPGGRDLLNVTPQDMRLYRCRVQYPAQAAVHGAVASARPPLVLFLKRGPFDRAGNSLRRYRLADHRNAILPADSSVMPRLRGALVRASRLDDRATAPYVDCGAPLASFIGLPAADHARLRCKITSARPGRWSDRVEPFIFAAGGTDDDTRASVPCSTPGEIYWNDCEVSPRVVAITSAQMTRLLRALDQQLRTVRVAETGKARAILSVWGPVAGTPRQFEIVLGSGDLGRVGAALSAMARRDSALTWQVNLFKSFFGAPLSPDSTWSMDGHARARARRSQR